MLPKVFAERVWAYSLGHRCAHLVHTMGSVWGHVWPEATQSIAHYYNRAPTVVWTHNVWLPK